MAAHASAVVRLVEVEVWGVLRSCIRLIALVVESHGWSIGVNIYFVLSEGAYASVGRAKVGCAQPAMQLMNPMTGV